MCRVVALTAPEPVDGGRLLAAFAEQCRRSREYQGHGYGIAWRQDGRWRAHRSLTPIWDDALPAIPPTTLVMAHARSAFRDEGIVLEHNMPFVDAAGCAFAFNGEVRGVRVRAPGPNGAWRLFNLLGRLRGAVAGDTLAALRRLDALIHDRSASVRALNLVVSDGRRIWVNNRHAEDPDYFTMYTAHAGSTIVVASEPLRETGQPLMWHPIPNRSTFELCHPAACSS